MGAPTIPGLEQLGEEIQKRFPPLNIEGRIQKILPKSQDTRGTPQRTIDDLARKAKPDKPDSQQVAEWHTAQNVRDFYRSPKFQAMPPDRKFRAEQWLYKNKIVPQYKLSGKQAPDFNTWVKFRSDPNFPQASMKMFDYWESRDTVAERTKDYAARAARSFTNGVETLFMAHLIGLDAFRKDTKPEELDTSKMGSFELSTYDLIENVKAREQQIIDKNSPVNATWTRKVFEGLSDNAAMFLAGRAVGGALGAATKAEGVTGILRDVDWAERLAASGPMGRFILNRIYGAADRAVSLVASGEKPTPENVAVGAFFPRGVPGPVQKVLKFGRGKNTGLQTVENVLTPEVEKASQQLGANLGVTLGAPSTIAAAHAGSLKAEGIETIVRDKLGTKLTEGTAALFNGAAKGMGYINFQFVPKAIKPQVINSVVEQMIEGMKNPAGVDPEITKFIVQHDILEATQKFPEYAKNVAAINQAASKAGIDPTEATAQEVFKEASRDTRIMDQAYSGMPPGSVKPLPLDISVADWPGSARSKLAKLNEVSQMFFKKNYSELDPSQMEGVHRNFVMSYRSDLGYANIPGSMATGTPYRDLTPALKEEEDAAQKTLEKLDPYSRVHLPPIPSKPVIKSKLDPRIDPRIVTAKGGKIEGEISRVKAKEPEAPKPPSPGLGPGAASEDDIHFSEIVRHFGQTDIPVESTLHQFVQGWGTTKDAGKMTPDFEKEVLDDIKEHLPPGVNERYITPRLLGKWWDVLKEHIEMMGKTGHIPDEGDFRGVFRSTRLGGQKTTWQGQLHTENLWEKLTPEQRAFQIQEFGLPVGQVNKMSKEHLKDLPEPLRTQMINILERMD